MKSSQELHLKLDTLKAQEDKLSQRRRCSSTKSKLFKSLEETSSLSKAEAEEKLLKAFSTGQKDCALWQTRYFKKKGLCTKKKRNLSFHKPFTGSFLDALLRQLLQWFIYHTKTLNLRS